MDSGVDLVDRGMRVIEEEEEEGDKVGLVGHGVVQQRMKGQGI